MSNKNKKSRSLVVYTLIIVLLFGALFALNTVSKNKEGENKTVAEAPSVSGQPIVGNQEAKVSVVEFGDYKCPSCKSWEQQIWPQLKKDYVDTGIATYSFINTLFHGEESQLAAEASEAIWKSNPEQFWNFHTALFAKQPDVNHDSVWVTADSLLEVARASVPGLDEEAFKQQSKSDEVAAKIAEDNQLVTKFNIRQTPTIMVNNIVIANPFDYEAIKQAIEQEAK